MTFWARIARSRALPLITDGPLLIRQVGSMNCFNEYSRHLEIQACFDAACGAVNPKPVTHYQSLYGKTLGGKVKTASYNLPSKPHSCSDPPCYHQVLASKGRTLHLPKNIIKETLVFGHVKSIDTVVTGLNMIVVRHANGPLENKRTKTSRPMGLSL